jgi:hypothetical protein
MSDAEGKNKVAAAIAVAKYFDMQQAPWDPIAVRTDPRKLGQVVGEVIMATAECAKGEVHDHPLYFHVREEIQRLAMVATASEVLAAQKHTSALALAKTTTQPRRLSEVPAGAGSATELEEDRQVGRGEESR